MANEVVKTDNKGGTVINSGKNIKAMLVDPNSSWAKELAKVLPSPKEVARFMACAMNQLANPKTGKALAICTQTSFYNCIIQSARSGILPDGVNAYLIPYKDICQLQYSYRGLCDMAIREGIATHFASDIVRSEDVFVWRNGELAEHSPSGWTDKERGEIVGVWVRAYLPTGVHTDMRMSKDEVDKVRAKSQNPNGVWKEWYEEMMKKTCLKRLFKTMQNTPKLSEAIATDNENYNLNNPKGKREAKNQIEGLVDEEQEPKEPEKIDSKSPLDDEK